MSNTERGSFEQIILCDDIRQEGNGKFLIIGMYNADILLGSFPAQLNLRLFVQYKNAALGFQRLDFLWFLDDEALVEMEGGVTQDRLDYPVTIALPAAPLSIGREGNLRLLARWEEGVTQEILKRAIKLSEAPIPFV